MGKLAQPPQSTRLPRELYMLVAHRSTGREYEFIIIVSRGDLRRVDGGNP